MLASLNIVIGLAAVYTAFSLLASWVQERIATVMQFRSKTLRAGIQQMINDDATRIDVEERRDRCADDEKNHLRIALVPAANAVHLVVKPIFNTGNESREVRVRLAGERGERIFQTARG